MAALNAKERDALKGSSFAVPSRQGLPIENEGHVRAAMARFGQYRFLSAAEKKTAYDKIVKKAKDLKMDPVGFVKKWSTRLDSIDDVELGTRLDRTDLNKPVITGGTATYQGVAARTHGPGDPLSYDGGKRLEYRDAAGLAELTRQLVGKPVIVRHPNKGMGKLSEDPGKKVVGQVIRADVVDGETVVDVKITDGSGISAIKSGLKALSVAYGTETDSAGYQRRFAVDHLAIEQAARCGAACTLRADSDDRLQGACQCGGSMQDSNPVPHIQGSSQMDPTQTEALRSLEAQRIESETARVSAEALVNSEKLRADTAEGKLAVLETEISDLKIKINAGATAVETEAIIREKVRADAAEGKVAQFDATFEGRVRQRVSLERKAAIVMGDDFRMDGMSDREIMATVVKKLDVSADIASSVPDGVITGRFLASTERHGASARALARVAEASAMAPRADARQEAVDKKRDAWRQPLPNAARKS